MRRSHRTTSRKGEVGALVGAYFGVQAGAAGKAQADAARDKAESEATALAAVADKGPALKVLEELRQPEPAKVLSDEQIDQVADAVQAKTGTSGEDSK